MTFAQDAGMSPLIWKGGTPWVSRKPVAPLSACALLMLLPSASCVPSAAAVAPRVGFAAASGEVPDSNYVVPIPAADAIASFTAPPTVAADPLAAPFGSGPISAAPPTGAAPAMNASIAFAGGSNLPADAFFLRAGTAADRARALQCLTEAVYYEAASESDDGQRAVAQVVLNRMRHPAYPASVCGVVYQNAERWLSCQFSFACDGARSRVPSASGWARARAIAAQALAGRVYAPVGTATHYHTWNVVPFWAHKLEKNAVVGMHIFYRLNGALGRGAAFRQRHAGYEPFPTPPRIAPVQVAAAPVLPLDFAQVAPMPMVTPVPVVTPLPTATVVPAPTVRPARKPAHTPTAPMPAVSEPVFSPIMTAIESSTIRDEYKASGTVRPEYDRPSVSSLDAPADRP